MNGRWMADEPPMNGRWTTDEWPMNICIFSNCLRAPLLRPNCCHRAGLAALCQALRQALRERPMNHRWTTDEWPMYIFERFARGPDAALYYLEPGPIHSPSRRFKYAVKNVSKNIFFSFFCIFDYSFWLHSVSQRNNGNDSAKSVPSDLLEHYDEAFAHKKPIF